MNIRKFVGCHKYLILILFAAILLRAIFFTVIVHNFGDEGFYPHNSEDAWQYFRLARNLVLHSVFSQDSVSPFSNELFRTPGYPFFISIFYRIIPAAWFTIIFQNILSLGIIILIYILAGFLLKKKRIALIAAGVYAFEPAVIYWNNQLLSETLFTFLILLAAYIFIKNIIVGKSVFWGALAVGALVSLANYTRPVAQFILFIFIIFIFVLMVLRHKKIKELAISALLMVIAFFTLSAPWIARNKILINTYDFSSASSEIGFKMKYLWMMYENRGEDMEKLNQLPANGVKLATIKYIARHPFSFLEIHIANMVPFFMGDSYFTVASTIYPSLEKERVIMETWFSSWNNVYGGFLNHRGIEALIFFGGKTMLLLLNILAFFGIYFWFRVYKKNRIALLFLMILIYYFVLATGAAAYSRFRQPVNPYIFIFIAVAIDRFIDKLKFKKKPVIEAIDISGK